MREEPKPCPFCGCEVKQGYYQDSFGGATMLVPYLVVKHDVRCPLFDLQFDDMTEETWNRRAPDPEKAELVEALRRLVLVGDLIFLTDELEQNRDELILAVAHGQAVLHRIPEEKP